MYKQNIKTFHVLYLKPIFVQQFTHVYMMKQTVYQATNRINKPNMRQCIRYILAVS